MSDHFPVAHPRFTWYNVIQQEKHKVYCKWQCGKESMTCAEWGDQMKAPDNSTIQLFEDQKIRVAWDAEREEWYFSIVDVVGVLTDSPDYNTGRKYWNKLKQRLKEEGSELVTNCHQLKMRAADGKNRLTDVADTEQLLMSMQDWLNETDRFLTNNRRKVLDGKGHISREAAVQKVGAIYDEFRKKQDAAYISDFDREMAKYLKGGEPN